MAGFRAAGRFFCWATPGLAMPQASASIGTTNCTRRANVLFVGFMKMIAVRRAFYRIAGLCRDASDRVPFSTPCFGRHGSILCSRC